jgi:hypothetical protein
MGVDYYNCGHCNFVGNDYHTSYLTCKGGHYVCENCMKTLGIDTEKCFEEICDCNCCEENNYNHAFSCATCDKETKLVERQVYILALEKRESENEARITELVEQNNSLQLQLMKVNL